LPSRRLADYGQAPPGEPRHHLVVRTSPSAEDGQVPTPGAGTVLLEIRLVEAVTPKFPDPPRDDTSPLLLRVEEVAKLLAVSRTALYPLLGRELPVVRVGRLVRVPRQALEDFIRERAE
jgi:excisionase family DNA binding protein